MLASGHGCPAEYTGLSVSRGEDQAAVLTASLAAARLLRVRQNLLSARYIANPYPWWASFGMGGRIFRPVLRAPGEGDLLRGPGELVRGRGRMSGRKMAGIQTLGFNELLMKKSGRGIYIPSSDNTSRTLSASLSPSNSFPSSFSFPSQMCFILVLVGISTVVGTFYSFIVPYLWLVQHPLIFSLYMVYGHYLLINVCYHYFRGVYTDPGAAPKVGALDNRIG